MASKFYGINLGQTENGETVTVGNATGATDVELRVDTGKNLTRNDVHRLAEVLLLRVNDGRDASLPGV